jgi:hypothetical protein
MYAAGIANRGFTPILRPSAAIFSDSALPLGNSRRLQQREQKKNDEKIAHVYGAYGDKKYLSDKGSWRNLCQQLT